MAVGLLFPTPTFAQATGGVAELQGNLQGFGNNTGLGTNDAQKDQDLYGKIAAVLNIILGFLGIIAVIMIITAGFKWMTAGGNEDTVKQARDNIRNAVIGLGIVLASYIIVNFAVTQIGRAVKDGTSTNPNAATTNIPQGQTGTQGGVQYNCPENYVFDANAGGCIEGI